MKQPTIVTAFIGRWACTAQFLVLPRRDLARLRDIWYIGSGKEYGKENEPDAPEYDFYLQRGTNKCYARWLGEPVTD